MAEHLNDKETSGIGDEESEIYRTRIRTPMANKCPRGVRWTFRYQSNTARSSHLHIGVINETIEVDKNKNRLDRTFETCFLLE